MLKPIITSLSILMSVPAMASFYENCEFEAEVASVTSLDLLNGEVTLADSKSAAALKIISVKSNGGHTDCTHHEGQLKIVELKKEDTSKVLVGNTIKANFYAWNSLTPDGVVGGASWELLLELPDSMIEPVKILSADVIGNEIVIKTSVSGGCGRHEYSLEVNPACRETHPVQCDAKLIHKSDDDCDSIIEEEARITITDAGLSDSYYNGAFVNIQGDYDSSARIKLPMTN